MAKSKINGVRPISETDVREYLATAADFSFEMRVLEQLRGLDFQCQHGGMYRDSVTGKPRQFDIHAERSVRLVDFQNAAYRLRLAVECTNLRDTSPLLVHATRRTDAEAYHELVVRRPANNPQLPDWPMTRRVKERGS